LRGLNPEQLQAVTLPQGHALVLAGAGSGKTRVLTSRMAWLLQSAQVGPGGLLAVTFTNKAAKEMLTRLQALLPLNVRGMWVGTFHGLCNRLLRAHHQAAGLPQSFQILDTQDQLSAVKRLCKQWAIDEERYPPKQLAWFISGCKEEGHRPGDVAIRDDDTRKKVEFYQLYEDQCQREGVVDFGELMLRSFELLRDHAAIRTHYQERFRHILVDEFQDTNRLQYAWLKQLVGPATSVLAVGDDDQSIYAFRGARVGNMADFLREFPNVQQVKLEENYRSHSRILDAANHLIAHNTQRLGKNLRTSQGVGELIRVVQTPTDYDEARWVVDEIRQRLRTVQDDVAHPRSEIALLYRSNAQSRALETALMSAAIPYRVYGGLRFFERAEIKHALAYLRLLENPRDDTSVLRVINFPPRGIGARSIEQLQDAARASGVALVDAAASLPGRSGSVIRSFVAKLEVMREATLHQTLRQIVQTVLNESGLLAHYRADRDGADRVENLEELLNAAESFVMQEGFGRDAVALPLDETDPNPRAGRALRQSPASQGICFEDALAMANAQAQSTHPEVPDVPEDHPHARTSWAWAEVEPGGTGDLWATLPPLWDPASTPELIAPLPEATGETLSPLVAFLTHAALEAGDNQAQAGQDAVQLMTVHAAKGLEFNHVFITGLEEGLFPHENSLSERAGLEEERRLMYVAITRARHSLCLSHAATRMLHGQTRYHLPSRFLDELPPDGLRWLTPKTGTTRMAWGGLSSPTSPGPVAHNTPSPYAGIGTPVSPVFKANHFHASRAAAPPPPAPPSAGGIVAGQQVFHNKFGEGRVLTLEGAGTEARAQINFPRHGIKWLALSVAKLTVI
jgi:DNA helicase-2/ATP-dependent DNA helicase PcrA